MRALSTATPSRVGQPLSDLVAASAAAVSAPALGCDVAAATLALVPATIAVLGVSASWCQVAADVQHTVGG